MTSLLSRDEKWAQQRARWFSPQGRDTFVHEPPEECVGVQQKPFSRGSGIFMQNRAILHPDFIILITFYWNDTPVHVGASLRRTHILKTSPFWGLISVGPIPELALRLNIQLAVLPPDVRTRHSPDYRQIRHVRTIARAFTARKTSEATGYWS